MSRGVPCVLCGNRCVPMADYDQPVCLRCDIEMEQIQVRARTVGPIVAPRRRRVASPADEPLRLDVTRPLSSYFGPAAPEVIEALVDAVCPNAKAKAVPA